MKTLKLRLGNWESIKSALGAESIFPPVSVVLLSAVVLQGVLMFANKSIDQRLTNIERQLSGIVRPTGEVRAESFEAVDGSFHFGPLEGICVIRASSQTIPDNTITSVEFDSLAWQRGNIQWNSAASTLVTHPKEERDHGYIVWGRVRFEANSSGQRGVEYWWDTSTGGAYTNQAAYVTNTGGTILTAVPFSGSVWSAADDTAWSQLRLRVYQNSGANLGMASAEFCVARFT